MFIWSSLLYKSKRRLVQTKVHFKFLSLSKSKRLTNLWKQQLQKIFLQCVYYRCNLLWWMFFVPCDNWKTLFFLKVCRYCEIFSTAILSFSLKQVFWKKSVFYAISTITPGILKSCHNTNARFQKKLSYTIFIHTWKTFVYSWLFL